MLVGKIFAPKWKHRKLEVRKQALIDLNSGKKESQLIFNEMAQEDPEIEIRKLALKRINDMATLLNLAGSQHDSLGEDISKRLGQLISQGNGQLSDIEAIDNYLRHRADSALLQLVLNKSQQESLRETALLTLDKNATYADTAMSDKSAALRKVAIEHISKISTIERVLKHSKTRDKAVYKIAKLKLDAHNHEKNKPKPRQLQESVEQLLVELNAIVQACQEQARWAPQQAQVSVLIESWQKTTQQCVDDSVEVMPEWQQQFDRQTLQFQQAVEQEKTVTQQLAMEVEDYEPIKDIIQEYCDKLLELSVELNQVTGEESLHYITRQSEQIDSVSRQIHADLPNIIDSDFMRGILAQYKVAWQSHQKKCQTIEISLGKSAQRKKYLSELQSIVQASKAINSATQKRYKKHLEYFSDNASGSASLDEQVKNDRRQYNELLQQLDERFQNQAVANTQRLDDLSALIPELERALSNGKAKFAINLTRRWVKINGELDASMRQSKKYQTLSSHYKQLQLKVGELREWREWSNLPVKEKLCQDVEMLAEEAKLSAEDDQYNYSAAMEQLKAYRRDWNKLVDSEFKPDRSLEKKFNAACDKISRASQTFFSGLSQERQASLEKRQQYCADLDAYFQKLNATSINEVDHKHLDKVIRVSYKEWHSLGMVDRAKKGSINAQFSTTMSTLTSIRDKIRDANADEKNSLLTRAKKALADVENDNKHIASSIDNIKRLQSQWKAIGVASKDRDLWQEFQQTCNKVFDCRQMQNKQQAVVRSQQRQELEQLCQDIEKLSIDDFDSVAKAKQQFTDFRRQWTEKSPALDIKALQTRFKHACQGFEATLKQHQRNIQRGNITARLQLWDSCIDMESLLANCLTESKNSAEIESDIKAMQDLHQGLTVPSGSYTKSLQARIKDLNQCFSNIVQATDSGADVRESLRAQEIGNIKRRQELCLHLEILANIESPADETSARMALQVSMLASRMTEGSIGDTSMHDEALRLVDAWHQSGVVIDPIAALLETRFRSAINKINCSDEA